MKIDSLNDGYDIGHLFISKGPIVKGKYHSPELSIDEFWKFVDESPYLTWEELNEYYIEDCLKRNPYYLDDAQPLKIKATSRELPDFIYKHQLYVKWSITKRALEIDYWKVNKSMLYLLLKLANFMGGFLYWNNEIMVMEMVDKMEIELNSEGMYPVQKTKYSDSLHYIN